MCNSVTTPPPGWESRQERHPHPSFVPSTYVASKKNKQKQYGSQLQSSVTGYLTTRFSIIGLIKQPFKQTGLIHTNSQQIMLAYLTGDSTWVWVISKTSHTISISSHFTRSYHFSNFSEHRITSFHNLNSNLRPAIPLNMHHMNQISNSKSNSTKTKRKHRL